MKHLIQAYILLRVLKAQTLPPRGRQRLVSELGARQGPASSAAIGLTAGPAPQQHPRHPPSSAEVLKSISTLMQ